MTGLKVYDDDKPAPRPPRPLNQEVSLGGHKNKNRLCKNSSKRDFKKPASSRGYLPVLPSRGYGGGAQEITQASVHCLLLLI